ncbi:OLC1v1037109C1 [Oldenlandia corymbosa var. corymbosa]|uniref:OLC1v1037109C1 n=1 Tax=Oldenlandia corymbosa var. corymbosa TaxID=529605 RepID=A0AAV1CWZ3_OLDCO|nr:OLC1v1037109C1 [Oldenlandia corymbosa var. corymbosa]
MASGSRRAKQGTSMGHGSRRSDTFFRPPPGHHSDYLLEAVLNSDLGARLKAQGPPLRVYSPPPFPLSGFPPNNPFPRRRRQQHQQHQHQHQHRRPDIPGGDPFSLSNYRPHPDRRQQDRWIPPPYQIVPWPTYDYFPHVAHGGKVVQSPVGGHPRTVHDFSYPEDNGPSVVALLLREGVLVVVNHYQTGPDSDSPQLLCSLSPRIIASISGGELPDCQKLLQDLQAMCNDHEREKGGEISLKDALCLMTRTLAYRPEVGLIAGWDDTKDCPALYRVDGFKGLMKGEIIATGTGFRRIYGTLNLNAMFSMSDEGRLKSWLKGFLHNELSHKNYGSWSCWAVDEATKFALRCTCYVAADIEETGDFISVYHVGRHGLDHVRSGEPIKEVLQSIGLDMPKKIEYTRVPPPDYLPKLPPLPDFLLKQLQRRQI